MLVLRRRRNLGYIYQERRFAQQIMEWPGMRMTPETTVNFHSPTVVTQGTPQTIFGTPGQESRANRRASKRYWELSNITDADRQVVMEREGGKSLNRFKNEKLTAETNYGQKLRNEVLHESRVRNQQGVINLNTHEKPQSKMNKGDEWLNRNVEGGTEYQKNLEALKKRAHDKKYMEQRRKEMEQRRLESAKKIEQAKQQQPKPQQPVQPKPTGSSTAFPSDLKNLPQQTPSIPSSPVLDSTITNKNSALTGLSNDLKNTNPQTPRTGGGSATTGAVKTGAATETASQAAAKKGVKFRTTAGRYALGGAATLGAGYLLYNHFKNKDKK